jgi:outer membrane protein assembly factor BamB
MIDREGGALRPFGQGIEALRPNAAESLPLYVGGDTQINYTNPGFGWFLPSGWYSGVLISIASEQAADPHHMIRAVICAGILAAGALAGEEWTRFRGPNGSGVARETGFPAELGKEKNVVWRTPVRPGRSSPVLTRRHVFLTAFENGKLFTQCLDRETGRLAWERFEERPREHVANHRNHPAAITPVTDGEHIYSFFPDLGLVSYTADGKRRWIVPLGPFSNLMGLGASPILAGGLVVLLADQADGSYIAAFDSKNGELRWKTPRDEEEGWGSPLLYGAAGTDLKILTLSRGQLGIHLAANGKRIATERPIAPTIVGSPVLAGDRVYVFGYGSEAAAPFDKALARFDKNGDGKLSPEEYGLDDFLRGIATYTGNRDGIVTRQKYDDKQRVVIGINALQCFQLDGIRAREVWRYDKSFTGVIPSPLVYDGVVYVVRNGGVLTALDALTGTVLKMGRLEGALGGYAASPVAADGKLYLASEDGKIAVVRAGKDWEVLAMSNLEEDCHATPALSGGQVYLRTSEALYRFGRR